MKKVSVKIIAFVLALTLLTLVGCTKGGNAKDVATKFNEDLVAGKAFKSTHLTVEDNETVETYRDSEGNIKIDYLYEDIKESFYKIDGVYTYYYNDELDSELYSDEEIEEIVVYALEDILFFPEDSMEAFSADIDSDVVESEEKNAYVIVGEYEDGSAYGFYFGMDGSFFELKDSIDIIRTELDESIVVELP